MINEDLIQVVFSEDEKQNITAAVQSLLGVIGPKAPNLSNDERREYGSVNETNKLKIDKARMYLSQYPQLAPASVNPEEFERDYQARQQIGELITQTEELLRKLTDIKILLDFDNYQDTLAFYRHVRYLANEKNSMAILAYNDMKQLFPHTKKDKQ